DWLESGLATLGFRLVFCWREPSSFVEARRRRLKISSNPSQYDNLTNFVREQEVFQELIGKSVIPSLILDVTHRSTEEQVTYVADWLESTGGLNAAESPPNPKLTLLARPAESAGWAETAQSAFA